MSSITLITGVMAAGKSSVAQAVAERLPQSVHIRGDLFRRMIVNGEAAITADLSAEAVLQLHLRYRLGTETALAHDAAGFNVVLQDIVFGDDLVWVVDLLGDRLTQLVVLSPNHATVVAREAARPKTGYDDEITVDWLIEQFNTTTPRIGHWVDSSDLSVAQTVDSILELRTGANTTR